MQVALSFLCDLEVFWTLHSIADLGICSSELEEMDSVANLAEKETWRKNAIAYSGLERKGEKKNCHGSAWEEKCEEQASEFQSHLQRPCCSMAVFCSVFFLLGCSLCNLVADSVIWGCAHAKKKVRGRAQAVHCSSCGSY